MKQAIPLLVALVVCLSGCAYPGDTPEMTSARRRAAVGGVLRFLSEPAPPLTLKQCVFPELRPIYPTYYAAP